MLNKSVLRLSVSGLLIALGIVVPMFSPVKIPLGPFGSFTLASHVAIFIAMFISPGMALVVAAGTTVGFLLGGFPPVIVLRAATHLIYATVGAIYLSKVPSITASIIKLRVFSFCIALIHGVSEVIAVSFMFLGGGMSTDKGYLATVILSVGLVTVIHSMVDFEIANVIVLLLRKQKVFGDMIVKKRPTA